MGRAVVGRLRGGGPVRAVGRSPARVREALGAGVEAVGWDDPRALAAAVDGARAVVSLAGEPIVGLWTKRKRARIRDSRVGTTRRLVEAVAAGRRPPAVFVQASAVGYYGLRAGRPDAPVEEDAPPGDDFLAQVCVGWEAAAANVRRLGVRVVCLRLGVVLGPGGGFLARVLPAARLGLLGPLGSGAQGFAWVSLQDVVRAVETAIRDERFEGAVNVVGPSACDQRAVLGAVAAAVGRRLGPAVPPFLLRLRFGAGAEAMLADTWVRPARLEAHGFAFDDPTPRSAVERALGAA